MYNKIEINGVTNPMKLPFECLKPLEMYARITHAYTKSLEDTVEFSGKVIKNAKAILPGG